MVVGICVGIVDTIFGRGLLAISDLRTAHWRYLLPFLPLAGLLIVWMYHHFSTLLKGHVPDLRNRAEKETRFLWPLSLW